MRMIIITFPKHVRVTMLELLDDWDDLDWTVTSCDNDRTQARAAITATRSQALVDTLQTSLTGTSDWQIMILPVDAMIVPAAAGDDFTADFAALQAGVEPGDEADQDAEEEQEKEPEKEADKQRGAAVALREEIYQNVSAGAALDRNFLVMTVLSAIVAAIGMTEDSVAIVIGAMVIAPLLGPLLAFSFASALGDAALMGRAGRTAFAGVLVGFVTAFFIGMIVPIDLTSVELLARTQVTLASAVLALASGAAAALSITRGVPSTLVGVMVAVALLPPSVAMAMLFGAGEVLLGARAALLLATNVVSVTLASLLSFALLGIRPRTWLEQRAAKRSRQINIAVWGTLLIGLCALIWRLFDQGVLP